MISYHTAERMGWSRWTRKRRRKFKKRYFAQNGRRFRWWSAQFRWGSYDVAYAGPVILFQRNPTVGLGATVKPG